MMPIDPVRFGQHDAMLTSLTERVGNVEDYCAVMNGKLDQLLLRDAERKGERRVAGWLSGTFAGAAVSLAIAYLRSKFGGHQ